MTPATDPPYQGEAAALAGLLTEQRNLYSDLGSLSSRQAELITENRTEELLGVLSQRQALVEQLGQVNEKIGPYRGRIPDIAADLPEPQRVGLRSLIDEVQDLLQSIIHQDEADRQQLEARRQDVGARLGKTARAGIAMNAYRQNNAQSGASAAQNARGQLPGALPGALPGVLPGAGAGARFTDRAG